jgi:hypothetical protein
MITPHLVEEIRKRASRWMCSDSALHVFAYQWERGCCLNPQVCKFQDGKLWAGGLQHAAGYKSLAAWRTRGGGQASDVEREWGAGCICRV